MAPQSPADDHSWYVDAQCPKYFDFASALQSQCSVDRQYNPPLHDFVYQSDEESDNFFRNAAETPQSPPPKRPQHRMLSPRHFGNPTNKHRPKLSFEEFLRQHEMRQRIKNRRSVHILAPVSSPHNDLAEEQRSGSTASLEQYHDKRSRYKSLPTQRNDNDIPQETTRKHLDANKENIELQTPTLDSIITPVTMRRTARQYTPSRVRDSTDVARSLFASPRTPSASPMRRLFRKEPASRLGEPRRLSPEEQAKTDSSVSSRQPHSGQSRRPVPSRPPARTTPPSSGETIPSAGIPPSRQAGKGKSRAFIDRQAEAPADRRTALPLRAVRPTTSTGSTSTITPPVLQPHHPRVASASKSSPDLLESFRPNGTHENAEKRQSLAVKARQLKNSASFSRPAELSTNEGDINPNTIEYPDLLHKLEEHNRRLRKSGRQPAVESTQHPDSQFDIAETHLHPERIIDRKPVDHRKSDESTEETEDLQSRTASGNETKNSEPLSLNDLLQSENDRILNERKQRLPERKKAMRANKMTVLQRLEGQRQGTTGPGKRNSARVEFTAALPGPRSGQTAGQKSQTGPSGSVRFKSSKPQDRNVPPRINLYSQNRMLGVKKRIKSAGVATSLGDRQEEPKLPASQRAKVTRLNNKTSRTDQIKAATKQKLEENRLENDLQSMLNQHNNRVKNSRKVRT